MDGWSFGQTEPIKFLVDMPNHTLTKNVVLKSAFKVSRTVRNVEKCQGLPHSKKYFAVPKPLESPAVAVCGWYKLTSDLHPHSLVQIRLQLFKWGHFHIFSLFWPQMTFDLGIWTLTVWTYEGSHIIRDGHQNLKLLLIDLNQMHW